MKSWADPRGPQPSFDLEEHVTKKELSVFQTALPVGWTARELYSRSRLTSDYYYFMRELRFLHYLVSMREMAIEAL